MLFRSTRLRVCLLRKATPQGKTGIFSHSRKTRLFSLTRHKSPPVCFFVLNTLYSKTQKPVFLSPCLGTQGMIYIFRESLERDFLFRLLYRQTLNRRCSTFQKYYRELELSHKLLPGCLPVPPEEYVILSEVYPLNNAHIF